ncbi:hypothetical protein CSC75_04450 [Pseudoxanthomonas wuyuanensis]|nr:hypothetical protein CSC75_04450 [Pseudoxanthomonas wuyuanensis]
MLAWMFLLLATSINAHAQSVNEYLSVPGPLQFSGERYHLVWSSHPSPQLYKQEYLQAGDTLERYRSMLMLDVSFDGLGPAEKAIFMVQSLAERKKTDPVVNYELLSSESGNEQILDFLLSAPGADGQDILEWNAYRYSAYGDGVLLLAISRRAYGHEAIVDFLKNQLKDIRARDIAEIAAMRLPEVVLNRTD